jgi:predicted metal-dependent phosphoesterase TrpH
MIKDYNKNMKTMLSYYDIYPKILQVQRDSTVNIRPLGDHGAFQEASVYTVTIIPMNESAMNESSRSYPSYQVKCREGRLTVRHCFESEGQYAVVIETAGKSFSVELRVYAADEDLYRLRPYMGDLHVHSFRSDGKEAPAIVAAHYRKAGFDVLALTDHEQYEPSLEMIAAYQDAPIGIRLLTGEEVHAPGNSTHYIHVGGSYSINKKIREHPAKYHEEVQGLTTELRIPPGINPQEWGSCFWICREIHRAGGLAIMVHPHWIHGHAYHTREIMARFMLKSGWFDAFELIGGQTLEENQPQISLWQDIREEGCFTPVLGNSDSHGTVNSEWFNRAKSVILSENPGQEALFEGIRKGCTVSLEQYAGEKQPRLYGRHRYVSFVLFLLEEYFPLHDELCFEEGRLMKEYACGDAQGAILLGKLQGRCEGLMKKYWDQ